MIPHYTSLKGSEIDIVLTELCTAWLQHVRCYADRKAEKERNVVTVRYVDGPRSSLIVYETCYAHAIRRERYHYSRSKNESAFNRDQQSHRAEHGADHAAVV